MKDSKGNKISIDNRVGYQRRAIIGYNGGINLVNLIINSILEHGVAHSGSAL